MEEELVKMSSKGQLVVPGSIRKKEKFKPTDRFVAIDVKDGVLFKRIHIPNVQIELASLSNDITRHLQERGIKNAELLKTLKKMKTNAKSMKVKIDSTDIIREYRDAR